MITASVFNSIFEDAFSASAFEDPVTATAKTNQWAWSNASFPISDQYKLKTEFLEFKRRFKLDPIFYPYKEDLTLLLENIEALFQDVLKLEDFEDKPEFLLTIYFFKDKIKEKLVLASCKPLENEPQDYYYNPFASTASNFYLDLDAVGS